MIESDHSLAFKTDTFIYLILLDIENNLITSR